MCLSMKSDKIKTVQTTMKAGTDTDPLKRSLQVMTVKSILSNKIKVKINKNSILAT